MGSILEREVLPLVAKPHLYVGREMCAVHKDWDATQVRLLFCYPDVYEVGIDLERASVGDIQGLRCS